MRENEREWERERERECYKGHSQITPPICQALWGNTVIWKRGGLSEGGIMRECREEDREGKEGDSLDNSMKTIIS